MKNALPAAHSSPVQATVEAGPARLQVRCFGNGSTTLVMLPSLGRDVDDFHDVAAALAARGHRVLLPSPRGVGGSEGPLEAITLHDFAADVAAVIQQLGHGPAVVAGHAFGNWVARTTAVDHPALVRGVAVLAAAHKTIPPALKARLDACMDLSLPDTERLAHLRAVFFTEQGDPSEWLGGWHLHLAQAQRRASAATDRSLWWGAGQVPVLDVQAEQDPFAPASGAHLLREELGPDRVQIVVVPNAGHALIPEQPQAVVDALDAFLRQPA